MIRSGGCPSVGAPEQRLLWESAGMGRPLLPDGLRARVYRWPPLRLVRLCCEHESVCVVLPAWSPDPFSDEFRRPDALHRFGRSPRLL